MIDQHTAFVENHGGHRRSQPRDKGTPQEYHFHCRPSQHGSMQQNHPTKLRFIDLRSSPRDHLLLVPLGEVQLNETQQGHGEEQEEKRDRTQVHCSSRNSALKPGPNAAATAYSPALSGLFSSHSSKMKTIDRLESCPTCPRMPQHDWAQ